MLSTSGIEFIACDNPGANRMTIQILAVVAENEARMISERTRAAEKGGLPPFLRSREPILLPAPERPR